MQSTSDECVIAVKSPRLKAFSMHYYGPVDDDSWIYEMLRTATNLRRFDSHKLRIGRQINFAGNDLRYIRLQRAELLSNVSVFAPKLTTLNLQGCHLLIVGELIFLDTHRNFKQLKARGTDITVDTTGSCLNEAIVRVIKNCYRTIWTGEEEYRRVREDSSFGNAAREVRRDLRCDMDELSSSKGFHSMRF